MDHHRGVTCTMICFSSSTWSSSTTIPTRSAMAHWWSAASWLCCGRSQCPCSRWGASLVRWLWHRWSTSWGGSASQRVWLTPVALKIDLKCKLSILLQKGNPAVQQHLLHCTCCHDGMQRDRQVLRDHHCCPLHRRRLCRLGYQDVPVILIECLEFSFGFFF